MAEGFSLLDIGVLAVLLLSGLLALMRGFVHEVLSFSAWVGAAIIAVAAFPYAQPYARDVIEISILADVVVGLALFLVSLVLLTLFAKLLAELVQGSTLSSLDRLLGLLFGLARGAALVCLAWLILAWVVPEPQRPDWIRQARTLPYIQQGSLWLQELLPRSFLEALGEPAQRNVGPSSPADEGADEGSEGTTVAPQPALPSDGDQGEPAYDDSSRDSLRDTIETLINDGTVPPPDSGQQQQ
ncbi:MAG: CvpA family protein [Pseudomonadota bacterium]